MAKRRPKTGEARHTNQPVKIDRLPAYVHAAILTLRNQQGMTWTEIEALSAEPFGEGKSGFINWDELPTDVLELFPHLRLPHSNLHRWYDLRVTQVQQETMRQATRAQEIAKAFASATVEGDDAAVMNAARDTLMSVLCEDGTSKGRQNAAKALIKLGDLQQKARANDIKERKVSVDEQTLQIKLDQIKRKAEELLDKVGNGGAAPMSSEELTQRVREIYGLT